MLKQIKNIIAKLSAFDFFVALILINAVFIFFGLIFYNGNFIFWLYPFSYLSAVRTIVGLPNHVSSIIYSFEMFFSSLIMFCLFYNFYKNKFKENNLFILIFTFFCACGFLVATFSPDDTRQYFHILGSSLVVFSLWLITTKYLLNLKSKLGQKKYYLWQAVLQIPIFAYGLTYLFRIEPTATVLQKFAFLGLGLALLYATYFDKKNKKTQTLEK